MSAARLPLAPTVPPRCDDGHCVTCADEGVAMRVLEVRPDGLALCAAADDVRVEVMTLLVEPLQPGDILLVHAGTALIKLSSDVGESG